MLQVMLFSMIAAGSAWANDKLDSCNVVWNSPSATEADSMPIGNGEYDRMNKAQKLSWDRAYEPNNAQLLVDLHANKLNDKQLTQWKYQRFMKDYLRTI